ncbi:unnamed protein product [Strongylus vulgaris]|uniref:Uncharacterized protein n=1 Tax=Strongylus vulgaris TaxID=40348 RepID=A0A3P7J7R6_STRVU|nr:unnamed protein product [Strongylus vulgaris]
MYLIGSQSYKAGQYVEESGVHLLSNAEGGLLRWYTPRILTNGANVLGAYRNAIASCLVPPIKRRGHEAHEAHLAASSGDSAAGHTTRASVQHLIVMSPSPLNLRSLCAAFSYVNLRPIGCEYIVQIKGHHWVLVKTNITILAES